ncbi:hypothetical protein TUM4644_01140 [Shewanella colwelliana]|uniref:phospholipase D-like domain-containing protein n=1 Tax=Shewanella colwelliana TaxID=23 RepID=UPI001BB850C2|nr:phospholipase D-like domain-containing protein [Shewanella colwelliana]GIU16722.1 hypothetical protein TUM4644_01140 [Shewanella colwelliana]
MNKDTTGLLLFNELKQAEDHGVRLRIILDDLQVFNAAWIAELAQHKQIDIRIFNPFNARKSGWLGRVVDFQLHQAQLDNRLHDKYFYVDNQMVILGGRNIGDNYYGYRKEANFFDLDVVFKGLIISAFVANYAQLWGNNLVTPVGDLITVSHTGNYSHFYQAVTKTTNQNTVVVNAIASAVGNLTSMAFIRSAVTSVFYSLAKQQDNKPYFITRVERLMDSSISCAKKAVISTPYVIPTQHKFKIIETLVNNGAAASLINNSSASNDSAFVPADFEEYRPILMKMGVNLCEFRDDAYAKDHLYHVDTYYHNRTFILTIRSPI